MRRRECILRSRVIQVFEFGQGSEVRIAYLNHLRAVPLAFSDGDATRSYLPGEALLIAMHSVVLEIRMFPCMEGGDTVLQISRHRVHLLPRFLLLPTPQVHPYHLPEFRRTPPSSSPPTQCRPPSPYLA
ncbi:hypothetical protein PISMIDRAFT_596512 [Pisolithus microcarpus 441]|uniref:Uncharacterized protein n=1 Tax=Pisolithus microcarpus 441 TaxID=765257 RepID=A0A0C9YU13_9AGAM|nr:hypothetical protein PISMIDRAFT_596512 [Pisolithus microcarpus 441]